MGLERASTPPSPTTFLSVPPLASKLPGPAATNTGRPTHAQARSGAVMPLGQILMDPSSGRPEDSCWIAVNVTARFKQQPTRPKWTPDNTLREGRIEFLPLCALPFARAGGWPPPPHRVRSCLPVVGGRACGGSILGELQGKTHDTPPAIWGFCEGAVQGWEGWGGGCAALPHSSNSIAWACIYGHYIHCCCHTWASAQHFCCACGFAGACVQGSSPVRRGRHISSCGLHEGGPQCQLCTHSRSYKGGDPLRWPPCLGSLQVSSGGGRCRPPPHAMGMAHPAEGGDQVTRLECTEGSSHPCHTVHTPYE